MADAAAQLIEKYRGQAIPCTLAEFGSVLCAINARFDVVPTPETEYGVVRVRKP